jgi:regulator of PEP synthase PpsR (kinase-PPPase family)
MDHSTAASPRPFYIYLVSDATGTTLQGVAEACLSQFDGIAPVERFWPLVRSERQLLRVIDDIREHPGPVLFTVVDVEIRKSLQKHCKELGVPCMPVLDPIIKGLSSYLGLRAKGVPGLQHALDDAYFRRMDAVDFALSFDDGQAVEGIEDADVVLVGVSRTSKTPTCIFLARQGIRAANIPLVPGVPFPEKILGMMKHWGPQKMGPLFVGLTESPERLEALRRNRLRANEDDHRHADNSYLDIDKIETEIREARRFFTQHGWPVIDVTRRSVEETAAEIQMLLQKRRGHDTQQELIR